MEFQNSEVREEYERFQRLMAENSQNEKWLVYLNNFSLKLPEGSMRRHLELSDKLDQRLTDSDHYDYYKKMCSQLRLSQSYREFYETIDRVLREEGVFEGVLKCLSPPPYTAVNHRELYSLVFTSYFRLRDLGYNWFDLEA